jgi:hypothetical protein
MSVDREEIELFDRYSNVPTDKHEDEICHVLGDTFSQCLVYQVVHDLRDSK